jgi:hypothetical protein
MGKKKDTVENKRQITQTIHMAKLAAKETRQEAARTILKTVDASNNVSIPNYVYDKQLRVYREVMPPKNELFKAVGFNDQDMIKEIMVLTNQIPVKAAKSIKMARRNSKLASKLAKE